MTENSSRQNETPLESWKEIAAYLKRDVRTVKRWEKAEALPVRRHLHQARSSVYAYPSELEAWKAARQPGFDQAPLAMPWRRPLPALGFAVTLLLALISVASGPILTPPGALAQESGGMVARQVWAPAADTHGAPSSDGRYFPFTDWETGDLAIRDLTTGENRRLTNKGSWFESGEFAHGAIPSPDAQRLAYGWFNRDLFYELRVIGSDGSSPRVLYRNEEVAFIGPVAWSPDGKRVLASLTRINGATQIAWVSVADGSLQVLKTMDWRYPFKVSLSPDGLTIAYDFPPQENSPQRDIFLLAADGSREAPLVQHSANDFLLGWTPDGERLLFASNRTGSLCIWAVQVAEGKPQGNPQMVKKDVGRILPLGFTQDGAFFYAQQSGMNDVYVAEVEPATGTPLSPPAMVTERFVGSTSMPAWSSDGEYLAYVSQPNPHFSTGLDARVIIRSVETGEEREFWPRFNEITHLSWSPDGHELLLTGYDKNRLYYASLYRMDVRTGEITPIVRTSYQAMYRWGIYAPDGKRIFYRRSDLAAKSDRILMRDLQTGQEKELYRVVLPSYLVGLALSPDGRRLAFFEGDQKGQAETLRVMPAEGGEPRKLLSVQKPEWFVRQLLAWTPDARHILFGKHDSSPLGKHALWRISTEGGEPARVGLAMDALLHLQFHPDGQRVAFTGGVPVVLEIWVLENFLPKPETKAARLEDE